MLSQTEVERLSQELESDRVEMTSSMTDTDKYGEAICAFANDLPNHQKPGYLVIGLGKDGKRVGLTISDQFLQSLAQIRQQGNIVPPPAIAVAKFSFEDGDLAVVEVQPHFLPPVRFKGRIWIRNGAMKSIAGEAEERRLVEKRSAFAQSFDALPCRESSLEDLNVEVFISNYLPQAVAADILEQNHRTPIEQLASLKFYDIKANCPTHAGILLFGKTPRRFIPGAYIQYVKFAGKEITDSVLAEKQFVGDFVTVLRILDEFIHYIIVQSRPVFVSTLREEQRFNYPPLALRELMMNAMMHRDYQSNAPIRFYEFEDRVEIQNPGGLYGSATPQNFPTVNDYRNPSLAEAMKNLGYVNQFNVGIRQAEKWLKENGNEPPVFEKNIQNAFCVTVFRRA